MDALLAAFPYVSLAVGVVALIGAIFYERFPAPSSTGVGYLLLGRGPRITTAVITLFLGSILFLDLSWMQWTSSTAAFFIGLFSLLLIMTFWDEISPTIHTQGFLPIAFSRGERVFLSFMVFFGTMAAWIAFLPSVNILYGLGVAAVLIVIAVKFA